MQKYLIDSGSITAICDAIRNKLNSENLITFQNIIPSIYNIKGGGAGEIDGGVFSLMSLGVNGINAQGVKYIINVNSNEVNNFSDEIKQTKTEISNLFGQTVYGYISKQEPYDQYGITIYNNVSILVHYPEGRNLYLSDGNLSDLGSKSVRNYNFGGFINFGPQLFDYVTNMYSAFNYSSYTPSYECYCGNGVTNMCNAYYGNNNLYAEPKIGERVVNMAWAYAYTNNIYGNAACGNNVEDMNSAYFNCKNLNGSAACGPNVKNMYNTYSYCLSLSSAACSDSVVNMYYTYYECRNLGGEPKSGNNVVDMDHTYYNCYFLSGSPKIGPNVIELNSTYANCKGLTGDAESSDAAYKMMETYRDCYNLNGNAACGNNVIHMYYTYENCNNLMHGVCGPNVRNMYASYYQCSNLKTGVIGPMVQTIVEAYHGCYNLENFYIYSPSVNMANYGNIPSIDARIGNDTVYLNMFIYDNCSSGRQLKTYLDTRSFGTTSTGKFMFTKVNDSYYHLPEANMSVTFWPLTEFNVDECPYISIGGLDIQNNIVAAQDLNYSASYVYLPITVQGYSVDYSYCNFNNFPSSTSLINYECEDNTYPIKVLCNNLFNYKQMTIESGYMNVTFDAIGDATCMFSGCQLITLYSLPNIVNARNMISTFSGCSNILAQPICDDTVVNFQSCYSGCVNLTGPAVCGNNVVNMASTYYGCINLTGQPIIGPNVTNIDYTYFNCQSLSGTAAYSDIVTNMNNTYAYSSIEYPTCGINVVNMINTYQNCRNLKGTAVCGNNVKNMTDAYRNSSIEIGYVGPNVVAGFTAFAHCNNLTSIIIDSNARNLSSLCLNCENLTSIVGDNGSLPILRYMRSGFENCINLNGDFEFCVEKNTYNNAMFSNCFRATDFSNVVIHTNGISSSAYEDYVGWSGTNIANMFVRPLTTTPNRLNVYIESFPIVNRIVNSSAYIFGVNKLGALTKYTTPELFEFNGNKYNITYSSYNATANAYLYVIEAFKEE